MGKLIRKVLDNLLDPEKRRLESEKARVKEMTKLVNHLAIIVVISALLGVGLSFMLFSLEAYLGQNEFDDKAPGLIATIVACFIGSIVCLIFRKWLKRKYL